MTYKTKKTLGFRVVQVKKSKSISRETSQRLFEKTLHSSNETVSLKPQGTSLYGPICPNEKSINYNNPNDDY